MNNCHSIINNYPIDYNKFPLAINSQMYKSEILPGQYICIPNYWYHWIISEPNTLSVNYQIEHINFTNKENIFYNSFVKSSPFVGTSNLINITYDQFISNSLKFQYNALFSENKDCSPVIKNNLFKCFYQDTLENIINKSIKYNYYTYIGNNNIDNYNILSKYKNINYILGKNYNKIVYDSSVWFNLNKQIDSGLHNDPTYNIIYLISGKKTIYLFNPDSKKNLYINVYPLISFVDSNFWS